MLRNVMSSGLYAALGAAATIAPQKAKVQPPVRTRRPAPPPKPNGDASPWLVLGAAFAVGMLAAKALDWRGHAHPRW